MNRVIKTVAQILLVSVFLVISAVSAFAAEIRRVPDYDLVEQGLMALTLDVEGAENFRYTGKENNMHVYRGKIKPESKLKLVIKATLGGLKTLPITGRSCTVRMQVVAKKGSEVIKTQNFKSDNKSNVFANYTVPQNADTVEVSETFVLNNKSKNQEYNKQITERNKLILTTSDKGEVVAAGKTMGSSGDKKSGGDNSDTDSKEGKSTNAGVLAGAAAAIAAIGSGAFFFMKKRKENQAANEEMARKEKLREQTIRRQQELQQQNLQRRQEEINQHNRMLEEQRRREQEQARQQEMLREQDDAPHFCHNCGSPLKPGARFCENCGAKV